MVKTIDTDNIKAGTLIDMSKQNYTGDHHYKTWRRALPMEAELWYVGVRQIPNLSKF